MRFILRNSTDDDFVLKDFSAEINNEVGEWVYNEDDLSKRIKTVDRYNRPGGVVISDRGIGSRRITLKRGFSSTNDTDYFTIMKKFGVFFYQRKAPFYLCDTENNRRCQVELESLGQNNAGGEYRRATSLTLKLLNTDGVFEQLTANELSQTFADGDEVTIVNNGNMDCYPLITLSSDNTIQDFKIKNRTTNELIRIVTTLFIPPNKVFIDAINMKILCGVTIDTATDITNAIADKTGFFAFTLGDNIIQYISADSSADIIIEHREKYDV